MDREAIGFKTSAMEMQAAMAEQLALLDAQSTDWAAIKEDAKSRVVSILKELRVAQTEKPYPYLLTHLSAQLQFQATQMLIARLGSEMTETHKRLAKVEKAVKDLKLAAKCSE